MPDARIPRVLDRSSPPYLNAPSTLPSPSNTVRPMPTSHSTIGDVLGVAPPGMSLVELLNRTTGRYPVLAPPATSLSGGDTPRGTLSSRAVAQARSYAVSVAAPGTPLIAVLENQTANAILAAHVPDAPEPFRVNEKAILATEGDKRKLKEVMKRKLAEIWDLAMRLAKRIADGSEKSSSTAYDIRVKGEFVLEILDKLADATAAVLASAQVNGGANGLASATSGLLWHMYSYYNCDFTPE